MTAVTGGTRDGFRRTRTRISGRDERHKTRVMRSFGRRCLIAVFSLGLAVPAMALPPLGITSARAAGTAPTAQVVPVSSSREALLLAKALIATGRMDEARAVIQGWQPDHPEHRQRVEFVDGLIAAAEGNHRKAVAIYRGILADRPDLDSVRIELTKSLFLLSDDTAAKAQAERLVAAGVDDRIGGTMTTLLKVLDSRRPVRFSGYASLLPSSNVNNGTDRTTVPLGGIDMKIDKSARRKSGIGMMLGGEVIYRQNFTPTAAFVASLAGVGRFYPQIDRSLVTADASAGVEKDFGGTRVLTSVIAGGGMTDMKEDLRYIGGRVELTANPWPLWRLFGSASLRYEQDRNSDANSGWWGNTVVYADRMIGPSRFVRLIAGASAARKKEERFSYDEVLGGMGFYNEFPHGLTAYVQGTLAGRRYWDEYPGLGKARRDTRATAQVVLTKRDLTFVGFAPQLAYTFERNLSNAAFYDTTRHDVELRWTKDF